MREQDLAWARALRVLGLFALVGGGLLQLWVSRGGAQTGGPTMTLTPSGPNFRDFDKIAVSFTGFRPNFDLIIRQCKPEPRSGNDCDILTLKRSRSDGNGVGTRADYELRTLPRSELNSGVVCKTTTSCVIVVSEDLNDFSKPKTVSGPITVAQAGGGTSSSSTSSTILQDGETTTTTAATEVLGGGAGSGGSTGGGGGEAAGGSSAGGSSGGALSRTGLGRFPTLLMALGLVAVVAGSVIRARAIRLVNSQPN